MNYTPRIGYLLVGLLLVCWSAYGQEPAKHGDRAAVGARVTQLVRAALRRSEGVTAEGVRATWRATPTRSELDEVRKLGPGAVDALGELLLSQSARECQVAVRFMGAFDQSANLALMLGAVNNSNVQPACRSYLIAALRDAPGGLLTPALDRAAKDPDAGVRGAAARMLESLKAGQ
jgi:hypothetical protein